MYKYIHELFEGSILKIKTKISIEKLCLSLLFIKLYKP